VVLNQGRVAVREETVSGSAGHSLYPVLCVKLAHDVAKMSPHCVLGQNELTGHGLVRIALGEKLEDL
jgi:hypothetical protein